MKRRKDYKPKPDRYCERCDKQLVPRVFARGEEEHSAFTKRRFCSLACSNTRGKRGVSRTQKMVQARSSSLKTTCECCGGTRRLAIHHINENWKDNSPCNLQTLCVHCHQQWHGLHRKLKIKCFMRMPILHHLPVITYSKINWGKYDPRTTLADSEDMAMPSTKKSPKPSSKQ